MIHGWNLYTFYSIRPFRCSFVCVVFEKRKLHNPWRASHLCFRATHESSRLAEGTLNRRAWMRMTKCFVVVGLYSVILDRPLLIASRTATSLGGMWSLHHDAASGSRSGTSSAHPEIFAILTIVAPNLTRSFSVMQSTIALIFTT